MSVQDIQTAITQLPEGELESLMEWIEEYRSEAWDRQIAQDVEAGRFDALRERVRQIQRPERVKLAPEEALRRMQGFKAKRKEALIAVIREIKS